MKLDKRDTRLAPRDAQTRARSRSWVHCGCRCTAHRATSTRRCLSRKTAKPGNAGDKVLVTASTLQKDVRGDLKTTGNIEAAKAVGRAIAERAKAKGIGKVAFDRSGFMYHGRVKALADAAREAGLEF